MMLMSAPRLGLRSPLLAAAATWSSATGPRAIGVAQGLPAGLPRRRQLPFRRSPRRHCHTSLPLPLLPCLNPRSPFGVGVRWHSSGGGCSGGGQAGAEPVTPAARPLSERERETLRHLMGIPQPDDPEHRDVVLAGAVQTVSEEGGVVTVVLRLDSHYRQLKKLLQAELEAALPWATEVRVIMEPSKAAAGGAGSTGTRKAQGSSGSAGAAASDARQSPGLRGVRRILAVSSCKGGVGKSTVAVNLAYALSRFCGLRVGIFDADIYGPSLPTMVNHGRRPAPLEQSQDDGLVGLPEFEGVRGMSYGYLRNATPAIARGPVVSNVVMQLLTQGRWGDLDYLVIDLPPGTGDIQLTLTQQLRLDGSVIVTTPQMLSFVDVVKGIQMFDTVKVPIASVVENMAYFDCGGCDTRHHLFGPGYLGRLQSEYGIETSYEVPLVASIAAHSDCGVPLVLSEAPELEPLRDVYRRIAVGTHQEMDRLAEGAVQPPRVSFDEASSQMQILIPETGERLVLDPARLRRSCRCAACIDEFTGQQRLNPASVPDSVRPSLIQPKGNYAVAMVWSDGHSSSIYPLSLVVELARAEE